MKGNGKILFQMEEAYLLMLMEINIQVNGKMVKNMEEEPLL